MRLCTQTLQNDEVMYSTSYKMYEVWCTHNCTKWWGYVLKLYKMTRLCTQTHTKWWGYILKLYKMMRLSTQIIQNVWDWCTSSSYKMYEVDVHQTHTFRMRLMYINLIRFCMRLMYINLIQNVWAWCTSNSYKMYEVWCTHSYTKWWGYVLKLYKMM